MTATRIEEPAPALPGSEATFRIGPLLLAVAVSALLLWPLRKNRQHLAGRAGASGLLLLAAAPPLNGWHEVIFTARLGRELAARGELPVDELPRTPSGRYVRAAADAHFDVVRREVEASPEDWGGWYRLGLAYSASGDSRRARGAMRTAIALHRGADPETALARSGR